MPARKNINEIGRSLRLGRLALYAYHYPRGIIQRSITEGGPLEQLRTERGRREMIASVTCLPRLTARTQEFSAEVHFLTGNNYWFQTIFCYFSLAAHSRLTIRPVFLDDGTLTPEQQDVFREKIPFGIIEQHSSILERVKANLPLDRYPALNAIRIRNPLTRKIIDVHAGGTGWKMLLDSDMLFFREPAWLTDWLTKPNKLPAFMVDIAEAYGYDAALRAEIGGSADFPDRANIGFFGWCSENTDFDWLEFAVKALIERGGYRYNLTQGLTSMMFAGRACSVAPERDYIVQPSLAEGRNPTAVLHHYVAASKRSYFQFGWRHALKSFGLFRSVETYERSATLG